MPVPTKKDMRTYKAMVEEDWCEVEPLTGNVEGNFLMSHTVDLGPDPTMKYKPAFVQKVRDHVFTTMGWE